MAGNTIGKILSLTSFGESHNKAVGGVLDGMPSNIEINEEDIAHELRRRASGKTAWSSQRKEADKVEILSGIFENLSTGSPIAFIIRNKDYRPEDYDHLKDVFRASHADFTYFRKYGIRDHRGGGRASARETAVRVVAGTLAGFLLKKYGIEVCAYTKQIGNITSESSRIIPARERIESSAVRCPDELASTRMTKLLETLKMEGDTTGGIIECSITGLDAGLGEPVYDKLHADLSKAMMSINAAKGFEYGAGFSSASMRGSEYVDIPLPGPTDKYRSSTNNDGGIQGGISNGMTVVFRVAFKPVTTLMRKQQTIDINGNKVETEPKGRHDICVVPRAVPVVEAMAKLVIADHMLRNKLYATFNHTSSIF